MFGLSTKRKYDKKGPSPSDNKTCNEDFEKWVQNTTQGMGSVLKSCFMLIFASECS